ncbi:ribonuclease III domain-containing protein [Lineolata rhizophorae]|uniref:Ribonuclease III domain-containing protein n=1 Tax=Lineolata rhizophorae TaxID=578093 RepID=A0A6A6P597_9PEZI|nr:ribonuclease III domain-containing protein [Lineolata rhizophorae]
MKCLDKHFVPVYQKELPAMRNALLALNSKKCNEYAMRLKPKAWGERGTVPERLWLNVIDLDQGALGRTHQPLGLLTRQQMPDFPSFAVFPVNEKPEMVAVTSAKKSFVIEQELLEKLTTFTLRVYRDVFNKLFENDSAKMSYWIAPLKSSSIAPELDMETINAVEENEEYPWTPDMPHEFLAGKFLVDKWDGGRRFHTKGVAPQYRPEDPVPANTAKGRFNNSILDYSISLFKQSRERVRDCWSLTQPVIEADKIIHRRNLLAPPDQKESSVSRCFVCPQPLKISAIPTAFAAMTLVFPAVIHRLESYLVSLDACKLVDLVGIPPTLALEAVTKDSDNQDDRFGTVVLNFRPGMGPNYERLEFLGDCFLKLATTLSTFGQNPNDDEFHFHVKRMELLCNKNLFETAKKLRLHEYVRSAAFSRRTWYPEGLRLLEGKGHKNADGTGMAKHALGDKSLADVCEALIGAAFLAHNGQQGELWRPDRWTEAVKAVTAFVDSSEHTMRVWRDYEIAYANPLPKYQTEPATAAQRDLVNKIAQEHDYRFKYPRLLRSAFLHPSYPFIWEKVPSYQRLEFLGDALLDMACVSYLFYKFPSKGPQWLTEHKTAMASNKFLGALCVRLGWQRHLKHNHPELLSQIEAYATEVQEAEREAGPGARDYWVGVRSPPKCLPDIVEAYVGAMFIDSGFDYGQVQRFFDGHIRWFFEDMTIYDAFASSHPTTKLHHILSIYLACRDYRLLSKELPALTGSAGRVVAAVLVHGQPIGDGEASSGRYAKIKASIAALEKIEGLAPFEFRERFGCDCPREEGSGGDKKVVGVVKMAEVGTAI